VNGRLIAVFGYSCGRSTLHEICASRLRRAEAETLAGDVVLLSGWSRHRSVRSEAELMAEAWNGPAVELVVAPDARTTVGNARAAAELARGRGLPEVLLVTSRWHARRASTLLRTALRGSGIRVAVAPADGPRARVAHAREVACWALVPAQRVLARRAPGSSARDSRAAARASANER
jgi:uncharacterized SAM-binding protein YcdF (DUF218 family)